jgi:acid phosphatase type 7
LAGSRTGIGVRWSALARLLALTAAVLVSVRCGDTPDSGTGPTPPPPPPSPGEPVLVGAGDIAMCPLGAQEATARLLDGIGGTVFTTGDNVYDGPSLARYQTCYGPTWGRHLHRTRPVPGNHDYDPPGPAGYFAYFGDAAGENGLGFYSYDVSGWHVIALNSQIGMQPGSAQHAWLEADLAANRVRCTVAYFHHPLFSSSQNGPTPAVRYLWRLLYDAGADVVINGNDHVYERFAPQDPNGRPDTALGIRQFTVGTGGATLYGFGALAPNSETRASVHGVLRLRLQSAGYQWEFIPVEGQSYRDSGTGSCH